MDRRESVLRFVLRELPFAYAQHHCIVGRCLAHVLRDIVAGPLLQLPVDENPGAGKRLPDLRRNLARAPLSLHGQGPAFQFHGKGGRLGILATKRRLLIMALTILLLRRIV